jgi:hypothetical protein
LVTGHRAPLLPPGVRFFRKPVDVARVVDASQQIRTCVNAPRNPAN